MVQKIIKIGSSAGVTIPKKQLEELGLIVGDQVKVNLEPVKANKHAKLMQEYDTFVSKYGQTLKNLSDR
jgi:antitoxin component of MazEF toxin-antitoxin module